MSSSLPSNSLPPPDAARAPRASGARADAAAAPRVAAGRDAETLPQPPHIPALDTLRGVAVLMVLARHASSVPTPQNPVGALLIEGMRSGWMGVDVFFALSGFLITGILIDTKGTPGFLRNFYARRTLRIFPLYFAFLAALFIVGPFTPAAHIEEYRVVQQHQGWLWGYLTNVLISWQGEATVPFHLSHLWSLALEEQFYLVWPFIVLLIPRRMILHACLALSGVAVLLRVGLVVRAGWGLDAAYMLMPTRLDALLLGGALACLVRTREGRLRIVALQRPIGIAAAVVLAWILATRGGAARNDPYMQVFGYFALSLLAVVTIATALPGSRSGLWHRFLANRTLQQVGKYSYAIYIFQYPIINALERYLWPTLVKAPDHSPVIVAVVTFAVATLLSVAAARVSWVLIESPALALKRYFPRRAPA